MPNLWRIIACDFSLGEACVVREDGLGLGLH